MIHRTMRYSNNISTFTVPLLSSPLWPSHHHRVDLHIKSRALRTEHIQNFQDERQLGQDEMLYQVTLNWQGQETFLFRRKAYRERVDHAEPTDEKVCLHVFV